jgi:hypothetical protein
VALVIWVVAAIVWWAADWSLWWGPEPSLGLVIYAVLGAAMIFARFRFTASGDGASL